MAHHCSCHGRAPPFLPCESQHMRNGGVISSRCIASLKLNSQVRPTAAYRVSTISSFTRCPALHIHYNAVTGETYRRRQRSVAATCTHQQETKWITYHGFAAGVRRMVFGVLWAMCWEQPIASVWYHDPASAGLATPDICFNNGKRR